MPAYLQLCTGYSVNVVVQQSATRSPQCWLVLLFRLKKRSMYDTCKASFVTTKSCTRYVDNRLVVVSRRLLQDYRLLHFLTNNFYQAPVELEQVTSKDATEEFLGFDLQLQHHRLQLILRPERWQIREPNSAGPERHRTAAFHCARLHIERHVWPPTVRESQLVQLRQHLLTPDTVRCEKSAVNKQITVPSVCLLSFSLRDSCFTVASFQLV